MPLDDLQLDQMLEIHERKERSARYFEVYLWFFAALAASGVLWIRLIGTPFDFWMIKRAIEEDYSYLLLGSFLLVFPISYRLIFGYLPLEALRRRRDPFYAYPFPTGREDMLVSENLKDSDTGGNVELARESVTTHRESSATTREPQVSAPPPDNAAPVDENRILKSDREAWETVELTSAQLHAKFISNSRKLASGIYTRAGVYLLFGVLFAMMGLLFFYTQTSQLAQSVNLTTLLIALAPKFGILFFVEFIALFFLRQYGSAMNEFRYYEAIQRSREETLALLKACSENGRNANLMDLIKHNAFFSKATQLDKGSTTELIESKKLEKTEMELLEKVVEAIAKIKK